MSQQWVWRGFKSLNLRDSLTLPAATPFHDCLLTLLAYHGLHLLQINFFVDKLMVIFKGWVLFVRLCGMITNSQLFFAHNCFISSFSWAMKVSIMINERWSFWQPSSFFLADKYGKIITLKRPSHFSKLDQGFGVNATWKLVWNVNFGKHFLDLSW